MPRLFLFFICLIFSPFPLTAQSFMQGPVQSKLITERTGIGAGDSFTVGILMRHEPGWHSYWKSSETGYPLTIQWDLPEGLTAGEIQWAPPVRYVSEYSVDYVYEDEVLIQVPFTANENFDPENAVIRANISYLVCKESCQPGQAKLELDLSSITLSQIQVWTPIFEMAEKLGPHTLTNPIDALYDAESIQLKIATKTLPTAKVKSLYFYSDNKLTAAEPTQIFQATDSGLELKIRRHLQNKTKEAPSHLTGVLEVIYKNLDHVYYQLNLPLKANITPNVKENNPSQIGLGLFALAFIGGLILNLMPCVFPVLGIKIMGFVNQAGEDRKQISLHGLAFTSGVLISFWTLAGTLLLLRQSGAQLGWGFQLQSPGFVFSLSLIIFLFALSLSGLFEVGQSAVGTGSRWMQKSGLNGSFFSGVLATVVATPCSAPFLAPALGSALTLPPMTSLLVFTAIALGLSTPYLILSFFPQLIKFLPKPGAWMESFKQLMAFPLYATTAFLLWVLSAQVSDENRYGSYAFLLPLLALVLIATGAWVYGRWGAFHKSKQSKFIANLIFFLTLFVGFYTGYPKQESKQAIQWVKWSPERVDDARREDRIIYVDFTARWCATCQTNKATLFKGPLSAPVIERFKELNVLPLKADWTNSDPEITRALESMGRSAVPVNLIYGPQLEEPILLPEILTPGIVLEALDKAD